MVEHNYCPYLPRGTENWVVAEEYTDVYAEDLTVIEHDCCPSQLQRYSPEEVALLLGEVDLLELGIA